MEIEKQNLNMKKIVIQESYSLLRKFNIYN